eukprot:6190707-Pleurochrysis_carterae.AAC.1
MVASRGRTTRDKCVRVGAIARCGGDAGHVDRVAIARRRSLSWKRVSAVRQAARSVQARKV